VRVCESISFDFVFGKRGLFNEGVCESILFGVRVRL